MSSSRSIAKRLNTVEAINMETKTVWMCFERVGDQNVGLGAMHDTERKAKLYRTKIRGLSDRDIFIQEIEISVDTQPK
jgi:hypothetical protein